MLCPNKVAQIHVSYYIEKIPALLTFFCVSSHLESGMRLKLVSDFLALTVMVKGKSI